MIFLAGVGFEGNPSGIASSEGARFRRSRANARRVRKNPISPMIFLAGVGFEGNPSGAASSEGARFRRSRANARRVRKNPISPAARCIFLIKKNL